MEREIKEGWTHTLYGEGQEKISRWSQLKEGPTHKLYREGQGYISRWGRELEDRPTHMLYVGPRKDQSMKEEVDRMANSQAI